MTDDAKNPISDQPGQQSGPETLPDGNMQEHREAANVMELNEGENAARHPYMSSPDRAEPERAPESAADAREPRERAANIQPAKPKAPENDAGGADLAPREHRDAEQPDGDDPVSHRIGNRSRP